MTERLERGHYPVAARHLRASSTGLCPDCIASRIGVCSTMLAPSATDVLDEARSAARVFRPGERIFLQGDESSAVFTLMSGWVSLDFELPAGDGGITCFVVPGDLFGLTPAGAPNSATARAITEAIVCSIPLRRHEALRREFPEFNERFIWQIERDGSLMLETLSHIAGASAVTRVAHLLLSLAARAVAPLPIVENEPVWLPITQRHVAAATGLTTVSVNRTLQRLRADRILDLQRYSLAIFDLDGLKKLARGNSAFLELWRARASDGRREFVDRRRSTESHVH